MVVALVALAVASGGTAVAATIITSKQIKDRTIQLVDISGAAKAGLKGNQGLQGPAGAQGSRGLPGPQGLQGPQGVPGLGVVRFQDGPFVNAPSSGASEPRQSFPFALCPSTGLVAIGGAVTTSAGTPGGPPAGTMSVAESGFAEFDVRGVPHGWSGVVNDTSNTGPLDLGDAFAFATVVCVSATDATAAGATPVALARKVSDGRRAK